MVDHFKIPDIARMISLNEERTRVKQCYSSEAYFLLPGIRGLELCWHEQNCRLCHCKTISQPYIESSSSYEFTRDSSTGNVPNYWKLPERRSIMEWSTSWVVCEGSPRLHAGIKFLLGESPFQVSTWKISLVRLSLTRWMLICPVWGTLHQCFPPLLEYSPKGGKRQDHTPCLSLPQTRDCLAWGTARRLCSPEQKEQCGLWFWCIMQEEAPPQPQHMHSPACWVVDAGFEQLHESGRELLSCVVLQSLWHSPTGVICLGSREGFILLLQSPRDQEEWSSLLPIPSPDRLLDWGRCGQQGKEGSCRMNATDEN